MIVMKVYYSNVLTDVEVFPSDTALAYESDTGIFSVVSDEGCLMYDFDPASAGVSDVVMLVDGHQVLHWSGGRIK
jgi:hypothetical protein